MDCFGVGTLEDTHNIEENDIPHKWWPFYMNGKQIGWVQLTMDGRTTLTGIRAMPGYIFEVKPDGESTDE